MPKPLKKQKEIKAWAIVDTRKSYPRLCYAGAKGTKAYREERVAVFFSPEKINIKGSPYYKKVLPITLKL